jgi:hypothetical protein
MTFVKYLKYMFTDGAKSSGLETSKKRTLMNKTKRLIFIFLFSCTEKTHFGQKNRLSMSMKQSNGETLNSKKNKKLLNFLSTFLKTYMF